MPDTTSDRRYWTGRDPEAQSEKQAAYAEQRRQWTQARLQVREDVNRAQEAEQRADYWRARAAVDSTEAPAAAARKGLRL